MKFVIFCTKEKPIDENLHKNFIISIKRRKQNDFYTLYKIDHILRESRNIL